ncbi:MAG: 2-oxoacid:acceptor oxidoreductase family protein [Acidobacteriota bacterium]
MIELRFHGRGGQGSVIASKVLASALFKEGKHVQAFPVFGVERRGAPVTAFLRLDDKPIYLRCEVYNPDHIIVLDQTLVGVTDITAGLKEGGLILINTEKSPADFPEFSRFRVATVDANAIAIRHNLGSKTQPIVNTAILGSLARTSQLVRLESVIEAIRESITLSTEENAKAAREAYESVSM